MEHEFYMREALKEASKALEHNDVPVGAIIVFDNKIIGRAHNQTELLHDPTAHAEMLAITQATATLGQARLVDAVLYVTLEPCSMCTGALVLARVKTVFYGAPDPKAGACGSVFDLADDERYNHQIKVVHGLMQLESQQMLQEFFQNLRNKK